MEPEPGPGGSCRQTTWPVKSSTSPVYWPESDSMFRGLHHGGGNCSYSRSSTYLDSHHHRDNSLSRLSGTPVSPRAKDLGPEVFRALGEPPVPLELPGSILAGKVSCTQRDLCVVMPSGQRLLVKCDVKSKAGDIFDLVVAHGNLVEHFYFGLAFIEDDEFFFLDHEMKIVKVAPECWKKEAPADIVLFLRVKFFVDDFSFLLHKLTRHQYYLQLRRDVLEDRLHADERTSLFLGALALLAEFGNCTLEACGKNWYRLDQYVSKCVLEKRALPCLKEDLDNLYASQARMSPEEAELQFIKVAQELPEYGVQFHRVAREKKCAAGEPILGICANGIAVFEARNDSRIAKLQFRWEETAAISAKQRKFSFKIGAMGQRYTFLTKSSKIARYLRDICSAQHKFHSEMNSRRLNHSLVFEENIVQYAARCKAQERFPDGLSCSVVALNNSRLNSSSSTSSSRSCGDLPTRAVARVGRGGALGERCREEGRQDWSSQDLSSCQQSTLSLERRDLETSGARGPQMTIGRAEREIICVSLKKDPKLGLGIVIVGDDNTEGLDLGIFIASVVPSGPADKDGRIRPGARLISLNKTSLEGVAFSAVAEVLQGSSEEVELIVSQPKRSNDLRLVLGSYNSPTAVVADYKPSLEELDKFLSAMMITRSRSTLRLPAALLPEGGCSRRVSVTSLKAEEMHYVKLKKSDGSLGFSVTAGKQGGIFVGSIVPGGVASQDGRLQIGDRLVEVDGVRLQGSTPLQALQYLRRTGEVVSLAFTREAPGGSQSASSEPWRSPVVPSNTRITQVGNGSSIAISAGTAYPVTAKDHHDVVSDDHTLDVTLKKNRGGLGFSFLISGQDSQGDCATTVRIKRLFPGQPAERCRLIQEGDIILAVNGERLKGLSYQRVLQLLQDAPALVRLSLCRPSPESGSILC